jgi:hypothetical protein
MFDWVDSCDLYFHITDLFNYWECDDLLVRDLIAPFDFHKEAIGVSEYEKVWVTS